MISLPIILIPLLAMLGVACYLVVKHGWYAQAAFALSAFVALMLLAAGVRRWLMVELDVTAGLLLFLGSLLLIAVGLLVMLYLPRLRAGA